jgi:lipoprotein NlpD
LKGDLVSVLRRASLWRRALGLVLVCLLASCASTPNRPEVYTVRKGDTLYSIATRYNLDFRDVARWNGIGRDYTIYPGQKLRLSGRGSASKPVARTASKPRDSTPFIPKGPPVQWQWPTSGTATRTERPNGGQGLTIEGTLNQSIRAAGPGRVVYTGSGLLGYGQLIIIKHNDTYLSAYAHTAQMFVKEGDLVTAGQQVATMGAGAQGKPMLYFEIRVNGKPVDPLLFLPRQ